MTSRRNTIQKDLVRNAVYEMKRHVTANEVYEFIKESYPTIRFDFTLKNHYHVRCVKCGEVSDVDMDEIPNLMKKIHDTHGIEFLDYDISFKGICSKCREEAKEE